MPEPIDWEYIQRMIEVDDDERLIVQTILRRRWPESVIDRICSLAGDYVYYEDGDACIMWDEVQREFEASPPQGQQPEEGRP